MRSIKFIHIFIILENRYPSLLAIIYPKNRKNNPWSLFRSLSISATTGMQEVALVMNICPSYCTHARDAIANAMKSIQQTSENVQISASRRPHADATGKNFTDRNLKTGAKIEKIIRPSPISHSLLVLPASQSPNCDQMTSLLHIVHHPLKQLGPTNSYY